MLIWWVKISFELDLRLVLTTREERAAKYFLNLEKG